MDTLHLQIRRALRRLTIERFLRMLARCWFACLLVALVAVAVPKFWTVPVEAAIWNGAWIGGALAVGLLAACALAWHKRQTALEAAIELDRRFGLKERVSSSLALSPTELETEAGQALVNDAARRVDRLDVAEQFAVRLDRWSLLPLAPAVAAFLLVALVGDKGAEQKVIAKGTSESPQQIKASARTLEKKLEERRREARKQGLDEAAELLKKLEQGTKDLADKGDLDRKQALLKLNDLAKDMEKRREKLAADDKLKQQLNQLKDLNKGPADKVADAIQRGDFKEAVKELDKLKQQLEKNQLNDKQKQDLAKQFDQMQQKLDKIAQAHEQAKQDLEKQIEQARQGGRTDEAEKLQEQLEKLAKQSSQAEKMSEMAQKMGQASKGLKEGDSKQAQAALEKLSEEMGQAQQAGEEMAMLDEALEELGEAKQSMACKECNGEGCAKCQGKGQGQGQKQGQKPGDGLGKGRGQGDRPEEKGKTGFYDSNVRQNVGKGAAVVTGEVDGPNRKGEVREEIKSSFETSKREAADPLSGQRLPRDYRDHAKTYFDAIRQGQKSPQPGKEAADEGAGAGGEEAAQ